MPSPASVAARVLDSIELLRETPLTRRSTTPARTFARSSPTHQPPPITATILTKNSEPLLARVLASLAWCEEVVILDTGSTDSTLAIAAGFPNVSLHQLTGPFPGFGRARQLAVDLARHDWILAIDSDEIVSPALAEEIRALPFDRQTVYVLPFRNFFRGKHIVTCGWSPESHERLFHRGTTGFCASDVHERVQTRGLTCRQLQHPVEHHPLRSIDAVLAKMRAYAQLFASQNAGRKKSSPAKAVFRSGWAFFRSYILERGALQGAEGLVISAYQAQLVFWKYLALHEANRARTAGR
ncbi:MAG TPA: glycosyltransferase family 2 protein [Opitutaceae bacterium]|nr:glycosyltransferase family 2 protein [Opitutaceae bacterium]